MSWRPPDDDDWNSGGEDLARASGAAHCKAGLGGLVYDWIESETLRARRKWKMNKERWQRIKEIYAAALDAPAQRRADAVREICGDDVELRREVEELLQEPELSCCLDVPFQMDAGSLRDALNTGFEMREGAILGHRFRLMRRLDEGGMGEVWQAQDEDTGKEVAIKTILPELREDEHFSELLKREVARTQEVNHPNICRVNEFFVHRSQEGDVPFLTMKLLRGETLEQKLEKNRVLPDSTAMGLLHQCAEALGAAHDSGLVHRDFKPRNVMLTEGPGEAMKAVVIDFGIARAAAGSGGKTESAFLAAGTPGYTAPEQARGEEPTPACDVYSFGVVACRVLSGKMPGEGGLAEVPLRWRRTLRRALDPDPTRRPKTPKDIVLAAKTWSRRVLLWGMLILLLLISPWVALRLYSSEPPASLAVLPLETTGTEQSDVDEGLPEELISSLSRIAGLRVVPWASSSRIRPPFKEDPASIARSLNARYLVTGSVRRGGGRVIATIQLVDAPANSQVWLERFDLPEGAVATIHTRLANAIPAQLRLTAPSNTRESKGAHPAAFEALLHGRYHLGRRWLDSFPLAKQYFEEAIRLDPALVSAYTGLAETLLVMAEQEGRVTPDEGVRAAEQAALKAIELDPRSAEGYAILGLVSSVHHRNFAGAEMHLERAISLDPNYSSAYRWMSNTLLQQGRVTRGLELANQAATLDPLSIPAAQSLAAAYFYTQQGEPLRRQTLRVLELDPNHKFGHVLMAHAYVLLRRRLDALRELEIVTRDPKPAGVAIRMAGEAYAALEMPTEARAEFARLERMRSDGVNVPVSYLAFLAAAIGDKEEAFRLLEDAWNKQDVYLPWLGIYPGCASLRGDSRYLAILERLGLTGTKRPR
ncbi:MAG: protein kinase domain-containing protein [Bryobacteraceae bacterium]